MRSISWMTFIFVMAFALYLRSFESFSSANRDEVTVVEAHNKGISRSLSSVEDSTVKEWSQLSQALQPQPSLVQDRQ